MRGCIRNVRAGRRHGRGSLRCLHSDKKPDQFTTNSLRNIEVFAKAVLDLGAATCHYYRRRSASRTPQMAVLLHRFDQNGHQRPQPLCRTRSDASQVTISASRTASLYNRRAGRVPRPDRRPSCPAWSRRIASFRRRPLTAANSSRMRPRSPWLLAAHRPTNEPSTRLVRHADLPMSAPTDARLWRAS
jgi:hypothetical protein